MLGEKDLDKATDEFLKLVSRFGKEKDFSNKQTIVLILWAVSVAIEASVQLDGVKYADSYKEGLKRLIDEIDDIVQRSKT